MQSKFEQTTQVELHFEQVRRGKAPADLRKVLRSIAWLEPFVAT